ncbi:hypothetical protein WJX72_010822 [[Myrmecia] bisecta]|uniref:Acid phosphatase n=1 Tax=[Myrmecia] bisecta TaxID=41462 RepID=A0AAW1R9N5_9CHLO
MDVPTRPADPSGSESITRPAGHPRQHGLEQARTGAVFPRGQPHLPQPPDAGRHTKAPKTVEDYRCLYPLGGGLSTQDALFDHDPLPKPQCRDTLKQYLEEGQYEDDKQAAMWQAHDYFIKHAQAAPPLRAQLVIFDIDDTVLSCVGLFKNLTDFGAKRHDQRAWREEQTKADLPANSEVLDLYKQLYGANLSVGFLTDRHETEYGSDFRAATVQNLERAGFGTLCEDASHAFPMDSMPARVLPSDPEPIFNRFMPNPHNDSNNPGLRNVRPREKPLYAASTPCYSFLVMRSSDDKRPASVFKPKMRGKLRERGYILAGNVGDQYTDFIGANQAGANFKLPNPMSYHR